ncbi:hypothetical protein ACFT8P_33830 [Streptomyces sp. NPDC057101]|uniref:hypothetical protein n=1 Tax=Streptomyces sp. NPDC057101 TaxID=3346020 RepID=UPI003643E371
MISANRVGETAFAVHAAHQLAPHFPDGQFHVDLRVMDPRPTIPRDALGRLLPALDVAADAVPTTTEDRDALLRSVLRDTGVLLILDNATDGGAGTPCSRPGPLAHRHHGPPGLVGLEAVHRAGLFLLRREEAVELLTHIVGPARVGQEGQATRDLAELCGRPPLAVHRAGQLLAARPGERLAKLVDLLAEQATG